ncbi:MAG TPA: hypothetical protein DDW84_00160 [Phycisphaerales bacterium]|nr:MAG: hypothetical protein A2Y13_01995 [Planctomycetes bacterium GWC2_45_44]HBG77250.1 hypothetical protein [Phycisphaerales bacterium]HBR19193.1 hypothetical protein [Phycisphaerales bacterium]
MLKGLFGIFFSSSILVQADSSGQSEIQVDVRKSDSHNLSSEVTMNTIENGAKISDHIFNNPCQLSVVFHQVNTWFGKARARDVWTQFEKLHKDRKLVSVFTEHKIYTNMAVQNVSALHTAPFKGALQFSVNFVQVNSVQLEYVEVPESQLKVDEQGTNKTASSEIDAGSQAGIPVNTGNESYAHKIAKQKGWVD